MLSTCTQFLLKAVLRNGSMQPSAPGPTRSRGEKAHHEESLVLRSAVFMLAAQVTGSLGKTPWWREQKIRFMWGQWEHTWATGCTPDELMTRLACVGATAYAEGRPRKDSKELISNRTVYRSTGVYFDLEVARAASKHGIRYFGLAWLFDLAHFAQENPHRVSLGPNGSPYVGRWGQEVFVFPCPLDKQLYERWFLDPASKRPGPVLLTACT